MCLATTLKDRHCGVVSEHCRYSSVRKAVPSAMSWQAWRVPRSGRCCWEAGTSSRILAMRAHQPTSEPLGAVEGRCKTKGPHWACTHHPLPVLEASWQCSRLAAQVASCQVLWSSWAQILSIMAKWEGWTSCHSWFLRSAVSFGNWGSFQNFHSLAPSLTLRCKAACGFHGTAQVADNLSGVCISH